MNARESIYGWTPLHVAVQPVYPSGAPYTVLVIPFDFDAIGFIVFLIRHGADLNVRDKNGNTPLHIAAWLRLVYTSWLLLNFGADPSARNNESQTPLDIAREHGVQEIVNIFEEFAKKP